MTTTPAGRRLILLRHAKSDWPAGVDDQDRPLAERGIADAAVAGAELAALSAVSPIDAVLCSPARRTQQTWMLASAALTPVPPSRIVPDLYGADVDDLLDVVRMIPHTVRTALVIGHEPTMSETTKALAGPGSDATALKQVKTKYPTSGIAVLTFGTDWPALTDSAAALEAFLIPRG
jgi:phosphohistidine phosphatase